MSLNQSTRQQFVIDFLKTATLVPQIGKGIYQGVNNKELGQNVLGQLANNLGKNGFNIVSYAYDVDEKLKNIIEDHYINGKYGVGLDEYNMSEIAGLLKPLLAEYGKDFYDIKFVEADNIKAGMSINDKEGVVYINTYGDGFGHSSQMLEQLGHEGMHGTYANHLVDEIAASMLTKIPSKGWSSSIGATAIMINAQGMIEASTNQYYKDRVNGDLRNILILREAFFPDDGSYMRDKERLEMLKSLGFVLTDEEFKLLSKYTPLTSIEQESILNDLKKFSLDIYREDSGPNGEIRLVTIEKASNDELKYANSLEREITLLIRGMVEDPEVYFSFQMITEEQKALGLASMMGYDADNRDNKIGVVYLSKNPAEHQYTSSIKLYYDSTGAIKVGNVTERNYSEIQLTLHEVGHSRDVLYYYKNPKSQMGDRAL
ncbi:hypothetical protein [Fusobacterium sp. PH5-44]|uniref:hypothetical protein n=1 Tax=unclassified Fusobacterium TaxID=2648384 RepID=UPI003D1A4E98